VIDGAGRKINYLRLSVTDLCNLRCQYCMPEAGVKKFGHGETLRFNEILRIVETLSQMGIDKVRITGGEPLVKKGIISLIETINKMDGIKELVMTTNGQRLEEMAESLKDAGICRINVSLDSLNPEKYASITRGGDLEKVLRGIRKAKEVGMTPIKLNVVLIGDFNDDEIVDFVELTRNDDMEVRFIELMPVGEVASWSERNFMTGESVLEEVPELEAIEKEDRSSPADYYRLPHGKGKVGIIRPITCKFCSACNRIRLTSDGKLRYCLHSNHELDLKVVMDDHGDIMKAVEEYISLKPAEHHLEHHQYVTRSMFGIGG